LGAIGVAIFAISTSGHASKFEWQEFVAKAFVSAVIGSFAAYAIVQQAHHRSREQRARTESVQLASLEPYIARFGPDQQREIKKELLAVFFARATDDDGGTDGARIASAAAAMALDLLRKLSK
jgi:hypothetical protein